VIDIRLSCIPAIVEDIIGAQLVTGEIMIEWSRRSVLLGIGGAIGSVVFPTAGMAAQNGSFGVVIYGATPSGIMAAYAAAREGVSVALVLAGPIGGMSAQGLGWTDTGKIGVLGGLCMEFFRRVGKFYDPTSTDIVKNFEPHTAEDVFIDFLREAGVTLVHYETVVSRRSPVERLRRFN
jgi:alkyl hydroperoxide reductase subunit AhpF